MEQLLRDIREFILVATKDEVTEAERAALRFNSGADIVEAIDAELSAEQPDEFDPYRDEETKKMLERAGIATYRHRR